MTLTHALLAARHVISASIAGSGISPLTTLASLLITAGAVLIAVALRRMDRNTRSEQHVADAIREEVDCG